MEPGARFVTLPSDDEEFARRVDAVASSLDGASTAESAVSELMRELQPSYPGLRVSAKTDLASIATERVWYVYRDGNGAGH